MTKISAKIITDSISDETLQRIVTFELEYPRFIHSEFLTHRVFSRNAASSRAIPLKNTINMVQTAPASPVHWGKNEPGMQSRVEFTGDDLVHVKDLWLNAAQSAAENAAGFELFNVHKQIANRILEPFVWMKTIVTSTEWDNWFELRAHEDAQPEIHELAIRMREAMDKSASEKISQGMWHCPYVEFIIRDGIQNFFIYEAGNIRYIPIDLALKISASCCAQVSYRKLDDSYEKAEAIYKRLIESKPMHASPIEHQATPMAINDSNISKILNTKGITHIDKDLNPWSGNFRNWIQFRQLNLEL